MSLLEKWNKNKFNVYESEEKSVLELIDNIEKFSGEIVKEVDNKTEITGDHKGSWQGINRPTRSDEGLAGTVEKIVDNDLPTITNREVYIKEIPRLESEQDDTERFKRAFQLLPHGGRLFLENEIYDVTGITIPDSIEIIGRGVNVWDVNIGTVIRYNGLTGVCIDSKNYYERKPSLKNLQIINSGAKSSSIGVRVSIQRWGASINIEKCVIRGFGYGVKSYMPYQMNIKDTIITNCGIGLSMLGAEPGITYADPGSCFGNVNNVHGVTFNENDISIELESQIGNKFELCDFENTKISILIHRNPLSGTLPNSGILFVKCWSEVVSKYVICNSSIDENFEPTQLLVDNVSSLTFEGCNAPIGLPSYEIPTFNENHKTFTINVRKYETTRLSYDGSISTIYNLPKDRLNWSTVGKSESWKTIHEVSNKGVKNNISFNLVEKSFDFTTTGITTQEIELNMIDVAQMEEAYYISSIMLMDICISHNDGAVSQAVYILTDGMRYSPIMTARLGDIYQTYALGTEITISPIVGTYPNNKKLKLTVKSNLIKNITLKINYLPSGLLV